MAHVIWQADFYRRPLKDKSGQFLWELLICDRTETFTFNTLCAQSQANSIWLADQLQQALNIAPQSPDLIQVFRPQCFSIIEVAGKDLGIKVEPERRTNTLKKLLQERALHYATQENYTGEAYHPLALDRPPPVPVPENLWGDRWRFATLKTSDLQEALINRPIPILETPEFLLPLNLGLASTLSVPGVVIDGGRRSMLLARWLQAQRPVAVNYIPGEPNGLILEAGLVDRWILATFTDQEVTTAAKNYEQRQQTTKGLHFLLVQPDDSGITYSGFWLLQQQLGTGI